MPKVFSLTGLNRSDCCLFRTFADFAPGAHLNASRLNLPLLLCAPQKKRSVPSRPRRAFVGLSVLMVRRSLVEDRERESLQTVAPTKHPNQCLEERPSHVEQQHEKYCKLTLKSLRSIAYSVCGGRVAPCGKIAVVHILAVFSDHSSKWSIGAPPPHTAEVL